MSEDLERLKEELKRLESTIRTTHEKWAAGKFLAPQELWDFGRALARIDEVRARIAAAEWRERTQGHA